LSQHPLRRWGVKESEATSLPHACGEKKRHGELLAKTGTLLFVGTRGLKAEPGI